MSELICWGLENLEGGKLDKKEEILLFCLRHNERKLGVRILGRISADMLLFFLIPKSLALKGTFTC